jgi:hypothetical protein
MAALGQQCICRWDYFVPTSMIGATAVELLTLLGFVPTGDPATFTADSVALAVQTLCSDDLSFLEVQVEELYTPTDFYTAAFSPAVHGIEGAGIASITDAFGFYSARIRTDIKRSFKRIPAVPADAYLGGSVFTETYVGLLTDLATKMSVQLEGVSATYSPATFQFQFYTTPAGNPAYKKYVDPEEQADHVAYPLVWTPYETVRTQVSRQIGRGV